MNRRGFLGVVAGAPIVGPAIARAMAAHAIPDAFVGELISGTAAATATGAAAIDPKGVPSRMRDPASWVQVLRDARARAEIESLLYEQYRDVQMIDPDIDVNRSFSRLAKITFQRQRNVAEALRMRQTTHSGSRLREMFTNALGFKL